MNKLLTYGLAAAAVVAIVFAGSQLFGSLGGVGTAPSASPEASPEETAHPSPSGDGSLPVGSPHVLWDQADGAAPGAQLGMRITVDIPATGWFGGAQYGSILKNDSADAPDGARVTVFAWTNDLLVGMGDVYVYGDPCHWATSRPDSPVRTVDEAIAALSAQPSRDASTPTDVTYDGYSGKYITLHVPDDAVFSDCDRGQFRTFIQNDGRDSARIQEDPGQFDLLTVLDVNGQIVIFDVAYYDGTPGTVLDEMASIVTSANIDYSP